MALEIVLGGSGAGKTHLVYESVIKESMKNHSKNYYIVVPDQFTMETQRDIVSRHPNGGSMNIDIVSFSRLAYRVFGELGINRLSVLDDTGKMLILRKVIEKNKDKLTIFKNKVKLFGFTEEIKSTISELYQYGINVDDIDEICDKISGHYTMKSKLMDIKLIYESFAEYMKDMSNEDAKYITKEEVLSELCGVIDESNAIKDSVIVLDGFTGFTPIQYRVIERLLCLTDKVVVTVTMSSDEAKKATLAGFMDVKEHELFNMSKETVNTLIRIAAKNNVTVNKYKCINDEDVYRLKDNKMLSHLEKNLFRNAKIKCHANDGSISIYSALNPLEEACGIVETIHNMLNSSDGKLRYRDIAIVTGDIDTYKRPFEEALMANGMPYFIDNKKSLLNNNFVECIRALLEMLDDDFSYESVFRYLKRGMSELDKADIDIFENYVLGCGIRGYKQYSEPFRKKYRGLSNEEFNKCENIRMAFVQPLTEFRENIKGESVANITRAIYKFIKDNDFYNKLVGYINEFGDEDSEKQEYSQSYRLIMELFDKMVSLFGEEIIPLREYRKILDDGLEEIKVGTIPVLLDQIVVGDIERTRVSGIKVLFVAGVNEGVIPKSGGSMGVLSVRDRNVLKNIGASMSPTVRENGFIQRFYLYLNLTKPAEKLVLTYSDANFNGDAKKPSFLIDTILKMYDDIKVEELIKYNNSDDIFRVISRESAFKIVSLGLRDLGKKMPDNLWKELFSYYMKKPEYREKIMRALDGTFFVNTEASLESAVAKMIFGNNVEGSITKIEKYAACAYAHFVQYGLNLVERPVASISTMDIGNIYHKAVEVFSNKLKAEGVDFKNISDEVRSEIVDISVKEAIIYYGYDNLADSPRNEYILKKVKKVAERSAWAICEHIKRGDFTPDQFEVSVGNGRVDRIDKLEMGDNVYVKIIDYKSGSTTFDTKKLINGLQLQLIYYMDSVLDNEKRANPDKNVQPGGVFYFKIKDPIIDSETTLIDDDKINEKMLKEFQMTGVFNSAQEVMLGIDRNIPMLRSNSNSPVINAGNSDINVEDTVRGSAMGLSSANFMELNRYVKRKARELAENISDGNIKANPYRDGLDLACKWCKYNSICTFSKREFNNNYRRLKKYEKPEQSGKEE